MCALLQVQPSEGCSELTHKGSFLFQNATISNEAQTSRCSWSFAAGWVGFEVVLLNMLCYLLFLEAVNT